MPHSLFIGSNFKAEFFNDKAKITNPGGIHQATLEQILDGVQTYRNPGLVNILNKLHFIENFGTGIPRILEAYENSDRKPEFSPSDNFFIVRLPNLNYHDPVNDPVNFIDDRLGDIDVSILRTISLHPGSNTSKILAALKKQYFNITTDMVKNSIKRKLAPYVEFKGSYKTGGYYIIKKGES